MLVNVVKRAHGTAYASKRKELTRRRLLTVARETAAFLLLSYAHADNHSPGLDGLGR